MGKLLNAFYNGYTPVPNCVLKDKRLDFRSRGVLITCLGLPDGWDFSVNGLVALVGESPRREKRDGINAVVNYLVELGYLERIPVRDPNTGKFLGYDWKINIPPMSIQLSIPFTD